MERIVLTKRIFSILSTDWFGKSVMADYNNKNVWQSILSGIEKNTKLILKNNFI